jgi:hypothetical protein
MGACQPARSASSALQGMQMLRLPLPAGTAELIIASTPAGSHSAGPIKLVASSSQGGPLANISNTAASEEAAAAAAAAAVMATVYAPPQQQQQQQQQVSGSASEPLPLRLLKSEDAERMAKQAARAARLITSGDGTILQSEHSTSGELPGASSAGSGPAPAGGPITAARAASLEFLPVLPPMHVHSHPVTTGQGGAVRHH